MLTSDHHHELGEPIFALCGELPARCATCATCATYTTCAGSAAPRLAVDGPRP